VANRFLRLLFNCAGKEMMVVNSRMAAIEAQQCVYTQLLQAVLNVSQQQQWMEACELPEGVALLLQTMEDLTQLEKRLENMERKTLQVNQSVQFYTLCPLQQCHPLIFVISLALCHHSKIG